MHLQELPLEVFRTKFIVAALDNIAARQALQLRAISSDATLIDAGTAGLSGSVRVFRPFFLLKQRGRCYMCDDGAI